MENEALVNYLQLIQDAFDKKEINKISISKKKDKSEQLNKVSAKLVQIKNEIFLSFTFQYPTQDVTKNFDCSQSKEKIRELLENQFLQSELYTAENIIHFLKNKKRKCPTNNQEKPPGSKYRYSARQTEKKTIESCIFIFSSAWY